MKPYKIFKDREGKSIEIYVDDYEISAFHDENKIAVFSYEVKECGSDYDSIFVYELYSMNVNPSYQMLGIGSEIIKTGEEVYKKVIYPQDGIENHPSLEGAALLNSCIRNRIIVIHSECDDNDEF